MPSVADIRKIYPGSAGLTDQQIITQHSVKTGWDFESVAAYYGYYGPVPNAPQPSVLTGSDSALLEHKGSPNISDIRQMYPDAADATDHDIVQQVAKLSGVDSKVAADYLGYRGLKVAAPPATKAEVIPTPKDAMPIFEGTFVPVPSYSTPRPDSGVSQGPLCQASCRVI